MYINIEICYVALNISQNTSYGTISNDMKYMGCQEALEVEGRTGGPRDLKRNI
jgi:DNA-binding CsgD family transcriptional regulator